MCLSTRLSRRDKERKKPLPLAPHFSAIIPCKHLGELGLRDECAREILRCAQDDSQGVCHPERSEGSVKHLWVITRTEVYAIKTATLVGYIDRLISEKKISN
jgi:hypothetical protein